MDLLSCGLFSLSLSLTDPSERWPPRTHPRALPPDGDVAGSAASDLEAAGSARQDLAGRLAQGFTGLLHVPPQFPWPSAAHKRMSFEIDLPVVPFVAHRGAVGPEEFPFPAAAVSSVIDIGGRLGQAGVEPSRLGLP
ncbi:hypothetical protein PR202_gn00304 [Eleusine coracana subsp. coracana]|uniref:Uncharacterized protein n=1 Tax=Eleusine coracana subsp. coracana TaxID=191504 RepID=A0AAV5G2A4_ELECO|nr:hypothetical protein PR202_gn00199 [Eleusine coracana subsp. coracana]GJN40987.1 hypothetical protein PR202_gn00304 [Eleusine coracana subsp. coracana]